MKCKDRSDVICMTENKGCEECYITLRQGDTMSSETKGKCQNQGCGSYDVGSIYETNCTIAVSAGEFEICSKFTTTPTQSIEVERLERLERIKENAKLISDENHKLEAQVAELRKDRERLAGVMIAVKIELVNRGRVTASEPDSTLIKWLHEALI